MTADQESSPPDRKARSFLGRIVRWAAGLLVVLLVLFGLAVFVASSALRDLDTALEAAQGQGELTEPPLSVLQHRALFVAAQFLPLRQPGAHRVAPGQGFRDCRDCPEMVEIPSGYFLLGTPVFETGRFRHVIKSRKSIRQRVRLANREGPRRLVRIPRPLAFSRHEITLAQWLRAQADPDWQQITGREPYIPNLAPDYRSDQPVTYVDWSDASAYATYLSAKTGQTYRLPTDAEWEYAARAGTVTRYNWGNDIGQNNASCVGCSDLWTSPRVAPVGLHPPNGFGLHDMHGNAFEWVEDCFLPYHDAAKVNGMAYTVENCEFRVIRGGGTGTPPWQNRSGFRVDPHYYNRDEGFSIRVVREMTPLDG